MQIKMRINTITNNSKGTYLHMLYVTYGMHNVLSICTTI